MLNIAMDYLIQAICMTIFAAPSSMQEPFRPIDGSHLSDRMVKAVRQAGTEHPGKSFWTAYTFDVRNGVAVRIDGVNTPAFQGKVDSFADTEVCFGTINGVPASTRNLAIFALHPAGSESVTRLEIVNLDKQQRPSDSNPVYWLGHAGKDESLNDVRTLAESGESSEVRARATLAVALQDDARASETLKNLFSKTKDAEVRSISIAWLGQLDTDSEFLLNLARQDSGTETQIQAINAIARVNTPETLVRLRSLYQPKLIPSVKTALINAIAKANDDASVDELMRLFQAERDDRFKTHIIYVFSMMKNPRALDKLNEIERQDNNPQIRKYARDRIDEKTRRQAEKERKGGDR